MATLSGTCRSAAPVRASSARAATCVLLVGLHVEEDLVVDLEDQVEASPPSSSPASSRTRATLNRSAASPWIPAFMAWRSAACRTW